MVNDRREYNPKAFQVFGPKLVATRSEYDDPALESRFLTEKMGRNPLRDDVPINLPPEYASEALRLRNKLLLYRLRNFHASFRDELTTVARELQADLIAGRGLELETQLLEIIRDLLDKNRGPVSVKAITALFIERHGDQYAYKISHRMVGGLLRNKLHLQTRKGHSTYVIPITELPRLNVS